MARIVVAPDSFKGSLAAAAVCEAIAEGWSSVRPNDEVVKLPLADGGEGTLEAFASAFPQAERIPVEVLGPDDRTITAHWLFVPASPARRHSLGVVELANTSGIELLSDQLRPFEAHTIGFGQAIRAALEHGVDELVLAIGSSASTDGGSGLLQALGATLRDDAGREIAPGARGIGKLASVELAGLQALPIGGVTVLTDVEAPLCGPRGAAAVFGPQKGIPEDRITDADDALMRYSNILAEAADLPDAATRAGAGAAGGAGFGLLVWGAELCRGGERVAELVGLAQHCTEADVVITGEGRFDAQSLMGKVPGMVLAELAGTGTRPLLIAGDFAPKAATDAFADARSLVSTAGSLEAALEHPEHWLREAARELALAASDL